MSIFISPHNDDETLFGAFTILRERPLVVIVFDGHVQEQRGLPVTWQQRRRETRDACTILGASAVTYLGLSDADQHTTAAHIRERLASIIKPNEIIFAPAFELDGHHQHNLVANAVYPLGATVVRYLTYTREGCKSTSACPVPPMGPDAIIRKFQALACYPSQLSFDPRMGCWPHFLRSQEEYYE